MIISMAVPPLPGKVVSTSRRTDAGAVCAFSMVHFHFLAADGHLLGLHHFHLHPTLPRLLFEGTPDLLFHLLLVGRHLELRQHDDGFAARRARVDSIGADHHHGIDEEIHRDLFLIASRKFIVRDGVCGFGGVFRDLFSSPS